MIQINLTPTKHTTIIECMTIAEKYMRDNDIIGVADMIQELKDEISLDTLKDKSKKVDEN